ncbi:efflux transporter outer membrane subunit [Flavisphingomonas formosensis]|uniref:efflux transporter outer membrane subunit n=1 Tax=Flavisphingomonas formosensis TaxID=861534 RepID=UPI0012F98E59|nr:efflux transporter outer membrane subunit [Sphingomonas formosensis]
MSLLRAATTVPVLAAMLLSGCSMAPHYSRPAQPIPAGFKEEAGWRTAQPADDIAKGQWWKLFGDPVLDDLEARVLVSNQNLAAAEAAYRQARATVSEQRAALLPTVDLSADATRAGTFGSGTTTINNSGGVQNSSSNGSKRYTVSIGASWEPDLWGRIGSTVRQAKANAQASHADLVNAALSAQGELALDYVQLRGIEAQQLILADTISAYERALTITTNRYNSGVVARVDVLQAETQLRTARASAADLVRQRAIFEHAIAVLVGESPSTFSIAPAAWNRAVPDVPGILPSALIERRPDVAAAERRVAAANQQIGIARAAFFPTIGLSGSVGGNSSSLGNLLKAVSSVWSLGATGALTLLDFGARAAQVRQARAAYDEAVATYRQIVLTAFQQTEDELAAVRVLKTVGDERVAAAVAANRVEQLTQNQYVAGIIAYTDVITAQTTALSARQTEASAIVDRQVAAITLIQAIGGTWVDSDPAK